MVTDFPSGQVLLNLHAVKFQLFLPIQNKLNQTAKNFSK